MNAAARRLVRVRRRLVLFGQRWRHLDKSAWVWLLAIAVLLILVVNPLFRLLIVSFQQPDTGAFTLANYAAAYSRSRYVDALVNSLVLGVSAAAPVPRSSACRWHGRCRAPTCRPRA